MINKLKGVALATLFGIIASIPWILIGYFGWVASLAGYLIGLGIYKGYITGNREFDRVGKITLIILVIILIPLADIFLLSLEGLKYNLDFLSSFFYSVVVFFTSFQDFAVTIIIGYIMAALGVYGFFKKD